MVTYLTDGELIWHGPSSNSSSPNSYWNFKTASLNGSSVLSYWYGYSLATFGHGFGGITILNSSYDAITTICVDNSILQINPGINVTLDCFHDQHESYITDYGVCLTDTRPYFTLSLTTTFHSLDSYLLAMPPLLDYTSRLNHLPGLLTTTSVL